MEESQNNEAVYSKGVIEMLTLANEYTLFLEKANDYSAQDIMDYMQKIFPLLYLKACLLPDIFPENDAANERFVTEETWEIVFNELRQKFENNDEYFYIDNSYRSETDALKASLADNLSDIYQDLKDFVMLYQKNTRDAKENAVYQCKYLFQSHWGFRIVKALKYLHYQKFNKLENEDDFLPY
jgi:hypothetical protein